MEAFFHKVQQDDRVPSIDIKTNNPFIKTQQIDGTSYLERVTSQFGMIDDFNTHDDELGIRCLDDNAKELDLQPHDHKLVFRVEKQELSISFQSVKDMKIPLVFRIVFNQATLKFNSNDISPMSRLTCQKDILFLSDTNEQVGITHEDDYVTVKGSGEICIRSIIGLHNRSTSYEESRLGLRTPRNLVFNVKGCLFL
jgi:hypothetical protein